MERSNRTPYALVNHYYARTGKRLLDFSIAAVALILLSPLVALVAVSSAARWAARCCSGSVAQASTDTPFVILKFRTMRRLDEVPPEDRGCRYASTSRDGCFARRVSTNCPSSINVLRGDMSLVGPAASPDAVPGSLHSDAGTTARGQARNHGTRAGQRPKHPLVGRAARLDVWYVDHHSLVLDLRILMCTIGSVLRRRGVNAPGEATMHEFLGSER